MPEILIVSDPKGKVEVATRGFAGAACQEASAPYERLLGRQVTEHLTDEFHQTAVAHPQYLHEEGE